MDNYDCNKLCQTSSTLEQIMGEYFNYKCLNIHESDLDQGIDIDGFIGIDDDDDDLEGYLEINNTTLRYIKHALMEEGKIDLIGDDEYIKVNAISEYIGKLINEVIYMTGIDLNLLIELNVIDELSGIICNLIGTLLNIKSIEVSKKLLHESCHKREKNIIERCKNKIRNNTAPKVKEKCIINIIDDLAELTGIDVKDLEKRCLNKIHHDKQNLCKDDTTIEGIVSNEVGDANEHIIRKLIDFESIVTDAEKSISSDSEEDWETGHDETVCSEEEDLSDITITNYSITNGKISNQKGQIGTQLEKAFTSISNNIQQRAIKKNIQNKRNQFIQECNDRISVEKHYFKPIEKPVEIEYQNLTNEKTEEDDYLHDSKISQDYETHYRKNMYEVDDGVVCSSDEDDDTADTESVDTDEIVGFREYVTTIDRKISFPRKPKGLRAFDEMSDDCVSGYEPESKSYDGDVFSLRAYACIESQRVDTATDIEYSFSDDVIEFNNGLRKIKKIETSFIRRNSELEKVHESSDLETNEPKAFVNGKNGEESRRYLQEKAVQANLINRNKYEELDLSLTEEFEMLPLNGKYSSDESDFENEEIDPDEPSIIRNGEMILEERYKENRQDNDCQNFSPAVNRIRSHTLPHNFFQGPKGYYEYNEKIRMIENSNDKEFFKKKSVNSEEKNCLEKNIESFKIKEKEVDAGDIDEIVSKNENDINVTKKRTEVKFEAEEETKKRAPIIHKNHKNTKRTNIGIESKPVTKPSNKPEEGDEEMNTEEKCIDLSSKGPKLVQDDCKNKKIAEVNNIVIRSLTRRNEIDLDNDDITNNMNDCSEKLNSIIKAPTEKKNEKYMKKSKKLVIPSAFYQNGEIEVERNIQEEEIGAKNEIEKCKFGPTSPSFPLLENYNDKRKATNYLKNELYTDRKLLKDKQPLIFFNCLEDAMRQEQVVDDCMKKHVVEPSKEKEKYSWKYERF